MADQTKIEWTDFTVNFWEGCQKVGPGCDNCYAEARDIRFTGGQHWGPRAPRRKVKGGIAKLQKINRDAESFRQKHGHWPRVFCSSLSDVFDNAVDPIWRLDALREVTEASDCRFQLLTKRVGNVCDMVPAVWKKDIWPQHVGLMITVVNQAEADRDIPKLLNLKSRLGIPWVGLSIEPLLGPVDLTNITNTGLRPYEGTVHALTGLHHMSEAAAGEPGGAYFQGPHQIDWVIVGGESGHNARPMHPKWVIDLRNQCAAAGTPFLFKQWGAYLHEQIYNPLAGPAPVIEVEHGRYVKCRKAGRYLHPWGEISEFPGALS